jgi:hypothetical protein
MKVFDPTTDPISLVITPRYYNIDNVQNCEVIDEDTNTSIDYNSQSSPPTYPFQIISIADGYITYRLYASIFSDIGEDKTYSVKITDTVTTNIIWRGKIFFTSQVTQKYKINV